MLNSGMYVADVATGAAGDALYAEGFKPNGAPPMDFSARLRAAGAGTYGERRGAAPRSRSGRCGPRRWRPGATSCSCAPGASCARAPAARRPGSAIRSCSAARTARGCSGSRARRAASRRRPGSRPAIACTRRSTATRTPIPTDPRLTRLSVSPKRFAVRRRSRTATRIRWRLSEPARVTLRVDRARPGFRRGGRCVARRPRGPDPAVHAVQARRLVHPHPCRRNGDGCASTATSEARRCVPGRYRLTATPTRHGRQPRQHQADLFQRSSAAVNLIAVMRAHCRRAGAGRASSSGRCRSSR